MPSTDATISHVQTMRTVELFADQEPFIRRNLRTLDRAIQQVAREAQDFLMGNHPRFRRLIEEIEERSAAGIGFGSWSDQRLLSVMDQVNSMAEEITRVTGQEIRRTSSTVARDVYQNYQDILSLDGAIPIRSDILSVNQIRALVEEAPVGGVPLRSFLDRMFTSSQQEDVRNELLVGAIRGEGIPRLTRRVRDDFDWLDNTQINRIRDRLIRQGYQPGTRAFARRAGVLQARAIRHNAITAVRTHMQASASAAMELLYDQNEDIIQGFEWNATMEPGYSRSGRGTCLRCASLDGTQYDKEETRPPIPLHPNCRCVYTPILIPWEDLGISNIDRVERRNRPYAIRESDAEIAVGEGRAIGAGGRKILGRSGNKPPDRTYSEWYDSRSNLFQVNVAGPTRANWLKQVESRTLNDLVHKDTGELKLLEELTGSPQPITRADYVEEHGTAREKKAFKKANQ